MDPIGVKDAPGAADEYDSYRGGVLHLLHDMAPAERIAAHLSHIEHDLMGLTTDHARLIPTAQTLIAWYADSIDRWLSAHPPPRS